MFKIKKYWASKKPAAALSYTHEHTIINFINIFWNNRVQKLWFAFLNYDELYLPFGQWLWVQDGILKTFNLLGCS